MSFLTSADEAHDDGSLGRFALERIEAGTSRLGDRDAAARLVAQVTARMIVHKGDLALKIISTSRLVGVEAVAVR